MKVASWFSAGVSSAVATKLALRDCPELEILYIDIDDQHPDSMRFIKDCQGWFGKEITILKSEYKTVENVCRALNYVNGKSGARCTDYLKKRVRKEWEAENNPDIYVWGFDYSPRERDRAEALVEHMPKFKHIFPLIDAQLTKQDAHGYLAKEGIKRPMMYDLGYPNNNCIGCVKGGKGYWNKIRKDFPEVFASRAKMEREIGASCLNTGYLDELSEDEGRNLEVILEDCGIFCQLIKP